MSSTFDKGLAFLQTGDLEKAYAFFMAEPFNPAALSNAALILRLWKRLDEAKRLIDKALAFSPQDPNINLNAATIAALRRDYTEAERLLQKTPDTKDKFNCLGDIYTAQDQLPKAERAFKRALPTTLAKANLGAIYLKQCRYDEAEKWLEQATDIREARFNLSLSCLSNDDFERAWPLYEAREPHVPDWVPHDKLWPYAVPTNGLVCVFCEQGLGDAIQFARFVPEASNWHMAVPESFVEVFEGRCARPELLNEYECFVPIMSLPLLLKQFEVPPPVKLPIQWEGGDMVGLCWAGNPEHLNDKYRSIPEEVFRKYINGTPLPTSGSVMDTMRVLSHCKEVITVDTFVAHLAASIGVPTTVLVSWRSDWRWGRTGDRTVWYDSVRVFRQNRLETWDQTLRRFRDERR